MLCLHTFHQTLKFSFYFIKNYSPEKCSNYFSSSSFKIVFKVVGLGKQTPYRGRILWIIFHYHSNSNDHLLLYQVEDMTEWSITNTVDGEFYESQTTIALLDALDKIDQSNVSMYWVAPDAYLGNKVTPYLCEYCIMLGQHFFIFCFTGAPTLISGEMK